ncbi:MAG: hypothetical protein U0X73_01170 [Thermoanaerobaculia bacterium]
MITFRALAWILLGTTLLGTEIEATSPTRAERRLTEAAEAILHADYRGDRAELGRRARELATPTRPELAKYRDYWIGFAYWRRALNGFNESPTPSDLSSDLTLGAAALRRALEVDPAFEDAQSALVGCLMNQMYLASAAPEAERQKILDEALPLMRGLRDSGSDNPRTLWILGGSAMSAPPPWGGDLVKATAIYERGLAGARREAVGGPRAPWEPTWGAPEVMMSLAWMHSHLGTPDRDLARAWALAALAMAPDWHYVGDILLPQIEALPAAGAAVAAAPACTPPGS